MHTESVKKKNQAFGLGRGSKGFFKEAIEGPLPSLNEAYCKKALSGLGQAHTNPRQLNQLVGLSQAQTKVKIRPTPTDFNCGDGLFPINNSGRPGQS